MYIICMNYVLYKCEKKYIEYGWVIYRPLYIGVLCIFTVIILVIKFDGVLPIHVVIVHVPFFFLFSWKSVGTDRK